jgi:hypothetical protein
MPKRRPTLALLALAGLLSLGSAQAQELIAPSSLRQGDPLLAWLILPPPAEGGGSEVVLIARLLDAEGKQVAEARCFDASAMLSDASPPSAPAAARASAPLAPRPEAGPAVLPGRRLLGALIPLPMGFPPGAYKLVAGEASAPVAVEKRSFELETIKLNEANTAIRTVPDKRKDEEAKRLYAILGRVDDSAVYAGGSTFLFPAETGWKSAGFGDGRRYVYAKGGSDTSVHAGIDWAVVTGTPVRACARGRVALVADREVTGLTVVVEHLPGLYSLYFHLSAIEVAEGDIVERGQRIALSGATGMATGPHLHWELRARGEAVDPEHWLGAALLDKDAVLAIMHGLIEGR